MNPATEPPPQAPPQPHRASTSCHRHPEETFTGFCPSCLCERLAVLDQSSANAASSSSRKPPASAALRAIFKSSGGVGSVSQNRNKHVNGSYFPELRRTKSFSASKNEGFSGVFEPQRKSCDVRGRSTLWSLFHQDDGRGTVLSGKKEPSSSRTTIEVETTVQGPVFESKEEEEAESETEPEKHRIEDEVQVELVNEEEEDEIRACEEPDIVVNLSEVQEIVEEEAEEAQLEGVEEEREELKPMKDYLDLDSQAKKPSGGRDLKEIVGSFWTAASVFSKKLQKWRQKQKLKKSRNGGRSATLPVEKPIGRQFRETQSEIADYGFGRRSCDTDPRFSLDAGRMSLDDPRYSFDEPRASWDGYLIGRTFPKMPTMLSVVEDAPVHVLRSDTQIPLDEPTTQNDDQVPGGSAQTRDYYESSQRRKSFERSTSIRKTAAAVVAEIDEIKSSTSNAKVSPATIEYIHGPKLQIPDRDLRDSNSNSLRDCVSETFEMGFRDNASGLGNGERKGPNKKSRRWSKAWSIWGFIHRRGLNKDDEDEDRYSRVNGVVERSLSESWPELRGDQNGEARGAFNRKVLRSNSSVSWRNSNNLAGSFGSIRKNSIETNGKKRNDEFILERNRSARYSPNNIENGLLRFYLTPLRGSRRNGSVGKSRSNHAQSIARSVLRLY